MTIQTLTKFRDDGKVYPSTMSSLEMLELGWPPSPVKRITWSNDDNEFRYMSAYPLSASIIPGSNYIAIVESVDDQQSSSLLRIISGDGKVQITVPNTQNISGRNRTGQFEWFNYHDQTPVNVVEIVFRPQEGSDAYALQIDAATGVTISAEYIRA